MSTVNMPAALSTAQLDRIVAMQNAAEYLAAMVRTVIAADRRRAAVGLEADELPDALKTALNAYIAATDAGAPELATVLSALAPEGGAA